MWKLGGQLRFTQWNSKKKSNLRNSEGIQHISISQTPNTWIIKQSHLPADTVQIFAGSQVAQ